ncbi:MAG TPA: peptide ABC transporter substrate-binding protein [Mycobacteriales bacterium]|jgi:peptide/nickel transport system substrate-binding protein|nr:peptide ABC transporter substrate-binding protein [Mycobacteriales bacterium]
MKTRPIHRLRATVVAGLAAVGLAAGLTAGPALVGAAPAQAANDGKTLTVALTQDIDSLNPFLAYYASSTQLGRLMYDFLTAYDPKDDHPVPGVADKWSTSADKLTWTYHIRTNEKWSDGKPVTAQDVSFTYNKIMSNPDWAAANGSFVTNFKSVTAPDAHTVVIKTKAPQATMLALDIPIVPEHVWKSVKDIKKYANDQGPVVGDGPFILTDYKAGQYVKLEANKNYWRGAPKISQLIFTTYKTSDAAVLALRKGEVDMVNGLTAAQATAIKKQKNVTLNQAQGKRFTELSFNSGAETTKGVKVGDGNPALKDKKLRVALTYAIDKQTLASKVEGNYAQVGEGYIPALYKTYHWDPPAGTKRSFDLEKANSLLDAAGYKKNSDGKRVGKDGKPLNFRYTAHVENDDEKTIGSFITGWFNDLGIGVTVQMESGTKLNQDLANGKWDMMVGGWTVNPDPDYVLSIQQCSARPDSPPNGSVGTDQYWCDPEYDKLYAQQLADFDQTSRAATVKQMQAIMYADAPSDILFYKDTLEAYRSDLFGGFQKQPDPGGQILNQDGFWGIYSATPASELSTKGDGGNKATGSSNASSSDSGGGHTTLIVVIVVIVVVLAGGGGALAMRRKKTSADERE